jgi:hypothetical protein
LFETPERKITFGRHSYRWKDIIKIDYKEKDNEDVDWVHLSPARFHCRAVVSTVVNIWVQKIRGIP